MKTIEFEELPLRLSGGSYGHFYGSAEMRLDLDGEPYATKITLAPQIAGQSPCVLIRPQKGRAATFASILFVQLEASIILDSMETIERWQRDERPREPLGYGHMQRELR